MKSLVYFCSSSLNLITEFFTAGKWKIIRQLSRNVLHISVKAVTLNCCGQPKKSPFLDQIARQLTKKSAIANPFSEFNEKEQFLLVSITF